MGQLQKFNTENENQRQDLKCKKFQVSKAIFAAIKPCKHLCKSVQFYHQHSDSLQTDIN